MQQDGGTIVDNVSDEGLTETPNAADGAAAGFNSPRPLRNREIIEPQLLSPRVRRPTRMATSPLSGTLGGGGNARKRQRKTPVKVLLTHSALMDHYSSSEREAIKRACDEDLRAVLQVFHEALSEADKTDIFASPVTDDVAPHYSETITRPMDFGTIQNKLHKYRSFRDYFAQVELVFSNAIKYNGWDCFIGGLVEDMQQYCTKFLLDAVGVNLQGHSAPAAKKSRRSADPAFHAGNKSSSAVAGKQRARRKPSATGSEDEEESWHSSVSESEEDEDEDDEIDEDDDDEDFSDGSDYGGTGRKRQLRRRASGPKKQEKENQAALLTCHAGSDHCGNRRRCDVGM
uniref:Bromo domain-containing protein n=1 Tax=Peronospora matthiolae TaxID=2874970 RepID=A0AAV1T604_9STRA